MAALKSLNMCRLCKKAVQISLQRGLHSGCVLSARQKKKVVNYTKREPGIQKRLGIFEDSDLSDLQETEFDEDDFIPEDSIDIENIDKAYDEDKREMKAHRKMVNAKITYSKYFAPPQQPNMLTCNEMECIKYLHQNDPINWDAKALSESFPATPEVIKKILKAHYKLTPERAKQKDQAVYKNWELLAAGKLKADPEVIEHCKKFIDRREVLLEQIKNTKFYLPEVKEEPTYNNGEMSKILVHYEKQLEAMQKERDCKVLADKSQPEREKKTHLELLHEEVKKVMSKRFKKKESSVLRKMVNKYSKEITFEELEGRTIKRAEESKKIDMTEKAILESKFGVPQKYSEPVKEGKKEAKPKRIPQKLLQKETSINLETEDSSYKLKTFEDDLPDLPSPDERTCFAKELEVGKVLNKIKNPAENETEKSCDTTATANTETMPVEEKERFDKQVEDIKNTPFWNNKLRSKEKVDLELQKGPVKAPIECKRITKSDVQVPDEYPLRIPIPKSKRGSGLTFRVKDCFYDDDGEFLYRVPGMLQEKINS